MALAASFGSLGSPAIAAEPAGIPLLSSGQEQYWHVLMDGSSPTKNWPDAVRIQDGQVKILDIPSTEDRIPFGYLRTDDALRNLVVTFEFRWGTKKFAPRREAIRNNGFLYHITGEEKVWPTSVECQVQEGDVGDFHFIGNAATYTTRIASREQAARFVRDGELVRNRSGRLIRTERADGADDWNTVEVTIRGDSGRHVVNGRFVNAAADFRTPSGDVLDEGPIAFQIEGAEITYRNITARPLAWPSQHEPFHVLVFSKTAGFRHDSIPDGIAAIKDLGERFGFSVEATEDAAIFTPERLAKFRVVVFLSTTGDILNREQEEAFEGFIQGGGGFVGVHAASDTEYDWPWYAKLVGAYFSHHPDQQEATVHRMADRTPSTHSLPKSWSRWDEWYDFRAQPEGVDLLLRLDESTYQGGRMGDLHPLSWQHEYDGGRSWYTAMGHTKESFKEPLFLFHILGGIQFAAGLEMPEDPKDPFHE